MSAMTDVFENALLKHVFGNSASPYTATPSPYVGLFSASPTDTDAGTEITDGNYARIRVVNWDTPTLGATENSSAITFASALAAYNVVAAGIFDSLTTGCLLLYGRLSTSKALGAADVLEFAASALDVTFD